MTLKALITSGIAALTLGAVACGSTSSAAPSAVTINLKVTGSSINPANPKAVKGQKVTMTITTDKDEEVHLHGYDIHFDCKANQPLSKTFTADKTGSFEMELEATSTHLTNFDVTPG
jgi:hypothetical protein